MGTVLPCLVDPDILIKYRFPLKTRSGNRVYLICRKTERYCPKMDGQSPYVLLGFIEIPFRNDPEYAEYLPTEFTLTGKARSQNMDDIIGFYTNDMFVLQQGKTYKTRDGSVGIVTDVNESDNSVTIEFEEQIHVYTNRYGRSFQSCKSDIVEEL